MIRSRRLSSALLNSWLINNPIPRANNRYRLRLWRENRSALAAIKTELLAYIEEGFDDARKRIRKGFEDNLSPFTGPVNDPAANYPAMLHRVTLQGYFGEALSVLAVEHWGAHEHNDWNVPALLFRFHEVEFQHLDSINERLIAGESHETDTITEQRPGRTGDDALAFRKDSQNNITNVLVLEAKCLTTSKNEKIEDAHKKLVAGSSRPSGVRELIELLKDYQSPEAAAWQEALLKYWRGGYGSAERNDGIAYICSQIPRKPVGRLAWMPTDHIHAAYTVNRKLEGMEMQIEDLNEIIDIVYRRA